MRIVSRVAPAMLGAVMVLAAGAAAGEDAATPTPTFAVEQQAIDLGEITAGEDAVAVFRFHNSGDTDVRIIRAKPS